MILEVTQGHCRYCDLRCSSVLLVTIVILVLRPLGPHLTPSQRCLALSKLAWCNQAMTEFLYM